jgi:hypothetical protein
MATERLSPPERQEEQTGFPLCMVLANGRPNNPQHAELRAGMNACIPRGNAR